MEIKAFAAHLVLTRIEAMEMKMLYQDHTERFSLVRWLRRARLLRGARQVTDIRELSHYLRADIGARDGDCPFPR